MDANAVGLGKTEIQHGDLPSTVYHAHILPFSIVPGTIEEPTVGPLLNCSIVVLTIGFCTQANRSSMRWQVISEFSGLSLDELIGNNADGPTNGIALDYMLHRWLGNLSLCFEITLQASITQNYL